MNDSTVKHIRLQSSETIDMDSDVTDGFLFWLDSLKSSFPILPTLPHNLDPLAKNTVLWND